MNKYKYIIFSLLFILGLQVNLQAQSSSDASEIDLFRGGYMDMNFGLNLNTIGSSLGSGSMGGLITSKVDNGALNVNLNPAHLMGLKKIHITVDSRLGLGTNFISSVNSSLVSSLNDEIASTIDSEFSNEDNWIQNPGTNIQPTVIRDFDIGFKNEISSLTFAAPVSDKFIIAGSYNSPVVLNLDMGLTGLSTKIAQEQGTEEVSIRFDVLMNISLLTQLDFRVSTLSLGGATRILDEYDRKLDMGFSVSRYDINNTRSLQADLSGLVVVGGADERYFNNPNDPNLNYDQGESNAFFMNAYGEFESSGYGFKLGSNFEIKDRMNISLLYTQVPSFNLISENKSSSAFLPVFIVGTGEEILAGDIEVTLDSLQANKPNLTTERQIGDIVQDGVLKLPSSLTLGTDLSLGKHTMVFNYTSYFGDLAFIHGGNTIGKEVQNGIGLGFDFRMNDRFDHYSQFLLIPIRLLFLDIDGLLMQSLSGVTDYRNSHYRFGGSFMFGSGIVTVDNEGLLNTLNWPVPKSISMGRSYKVFKNIEVGVTTLAFPDIIFKYSIGFRI